MDIKFVFFFLTLNMVCLFHKPFLKIINLLFPRPIFFKKTRSIVSRQFQCFKNFMKVRKHSWCFRMHVVVAADQIPKMILICKEWKQRNFLTKHFIKFAKEKAKRATISFSSLNYQKLQKLRSISQCYNAWSKSLPKNF